MKYYIVDTIGKHAGMHYYDESFCKVLSDAGLDAAVISNYSSHFSIGLLLQFYKGNRLSKVLKVSVSYIRYLYFLVRNRRCKYIYQSFGLRFLDLLFLIPLQVCTSDSVLLVHDLYPLNSRGLKGWRSLFYRYFTKHVVFHNKVSENEYSAKYTGADTFYVPHFDFIFDKGYNKNNIGTDVLDCIVDSKINCLYFGAVKDYKGPDLLLSLLESFKHMDKYNFIVAGKDREGYFSAVDLDIKIVDKYINDDETKFLFTESDIVLLPYRNIYQSGVLKMATYFDNYIVASDLDYFVNEIHTNNISGSVFDVNDHLSFEKSMLGFYRVTQLDAKIDYTGFINFVVGYS